MSEKGFKDLAKGKVKFFKEKKGFGFFQQENGPDIFFHVSKYFILKRAGGQEYMQKPPKVGDEVMFLTEKKDGRIAASCFMYLDDYEIERKLIVMTVEETTALIFHARIKMIKDKIKFMGVNILLPSEDVKKPTVLTGKSIIELDSVESCVANIAWAAANIANFVPDVVMEKVLEAIKKHELDSEKIMKTVDKLDSRGSMKLAALGTIF